MDIFAKTQGLKIVDLLKQKEIYPYYRMIESQCQTQITAKGRKMIMMGSNNYLGLSQHPQVIAAAKKAIDQWGAGCSGSRLLNGHLAIHEELEHKLAAFLGFESCLIFASGFMANQGALSALAGKQDILLSDKENHACIIDGCRLSDAEVITFDGNHVEDLENQLGVLSPQSGKMLVTDSVFSMSGRVADLRGLKGLAQKYGVRLFVDEAHGFGVLGPGGRGVSAAQKVQADVYMGTFSKTLGSQGGFVCSRQEVTDWLRVNARTMMFSAALSPANVAAASAALNVLIAEPERVEELQKKTCWFRQELERDHLAVMGRGSAIIPVCVGVDQLCFELAQDFFTHGVFVTPVIFPAVPKGQASLRFVITSDHQYPELEKVLHVIRELRHKFEGARSRQSSLSHLYQQMNESDREAMGDF